MAAALNVPFACTTPRLSRAGEGCPRAAGGGGCRPVRGEHRDRGLQPLDRTQGAEGADPAVGAWPRDDRGGRRLRRGRCDRPGRRFQGHRALLRGHDAPEYCHRLDGRGAGQLRHDASLEGLICHSYTNWRRSSPPGPTSTTAAGSRSRPSPSGTSAG